MAGIFKAYDIRGIYGENLDEEIARSVGLAFPAVLDASVLKSNRRVIVSRDMRSHSTPLAEALIDGLTTAGLDVVDIGLATTPMNYFAIGHLEAAGGIQVTASHNPAQYNGLKMSLHGARPVSGDHGIPLLEKKVSAGDFDRAARRGVRSESSVFDAYGKNVLSHLEPPRATGDLKVAIDAANGMGSIYTPLLDKLGIDIIPLYFELDGTFPNHEANPLKYDNLRDLAATITNHGADFGISFDGDADRAAFVDETGTPVGSDLITGLIAGELLRQTPGKHVLYDLRSSHSVPEYIQECGGIPVRERVGHSFMKATLRKKDGIFGGELAGHYYFRANYMADCALLAVVEILNLLRRREVPFSDVVAPLERYAKSQEINFMVEDKQAKIAEIERRYGDGELDYLDGITVEYPDWWFNVRPSNTEPYLRLVLEAASEEALAEKRRELEGLLGTPV
ncbi:MAG: phosphomannomutase/phosphoglucomutase [Acidobacteriota bacterium]|nr:phosphomannomutase/phosphoglucomutase [Acidobacteriota bacterium]